jgi:predicted RNase H-like HicB family nuclease
MKRKLTRIIRKSGRWFIAHVKEAPGVNTQGKTLAEARRNLDESLALINATNRELLFKRR